MTCNTHDDTASLSLSLSSLPACVINSHYVILYRIIITTGWVRHHDRLIFSLYLLAPVSSVGQSGQSDDIYNVRYQPTEPHTQQS